MKDEARSWINECLHILYGVGIELRVVFTEAG